MLILSQLPAIPTQAYMDQLAQTLAIIVLGTVVLVVGGWLVKRSIDHGEKLSAFGAKQDDMLVTLNEVKLVVTNHYKHRFDTLKRKFPDVVWDDEHDPE